MSNFEFRLPDIGEGLQEAEILHWFVQVGDQVQENDQLVEVQTDKAAVEITAPVSGTVETLGAEEGEMLKVGEVLVHFSNVSGVPQQDDAEASTTEKESPKQTDTATSTAATKGAPRRVLAAPSVRKAAREAGVDLEDIEATGPNGRVLRKDLERYLAEGPTTHVEPPKEPIAPSVTLPEPLEDDRIEPIRGLRRVIFQNMQKAASNAVLVSGLDEVNVTKLVEVRESLLQDAKDFGVKLTYLPFIIKAVAFALRKNPIFNSTIDEENMNIIYRKNIHIGVAMATGDGLIVPVVRHADQKTILQIAQEIEQYAEKAAEKKLSPKDLTGSTFTVSSTGGRGGTFATPMLNYPEVAILGVHRIQQKPIVENDEITIGHMMGMSITFDHRIIDGEPSGLFMRDVADILMKPERLLLHF